MIKLRFTKVFLIALVASTIYWILPSIVRQIPALEPLSEVLGLLLIIPSYPLLYFAGSLYWIFITIPDPLDFILIVVTYTLNLYILLFIFGLIKKLLLKHKRA